ncbi:unnamed protein product [Parnassius mnemosyne]|uniref:Integrase catalytic domain-containing protein n=1 Tax=Parnassius mnemosyne TaxID=213953 RepID=A0AAV1LML0_9NEOP
MFARFGLPSQLVTDNGPPFMSIDFKNYCKKNCIRHVSSAPYRPQANGAAENAVKTIKKVIKRAVFEGEDILQAINRFLFQYRNCEHATTAVSPAVALLGRRLRSRLDALRPNTAEVVRRAQYQQVANSGGSDRNIAIGDRVLTRNYTPKGGKWREGKIVKKTGPVSYRVSMGDGIEWKRHIDQVIPTNRKSRYSLSRPSISELKETEETPHLRPDSGTDDLFEDATGEGNDQDEKGSSNITDNAERNSSSPPSPSVSARALRAYIRAKKKEL